MKLVAFDLDGTLVGRDLVIRPRVRAAIARMLEAGIQGCIVTGRMYQAAVPYARELGFDAPVVCYQGAAIVDPTSDEVLRDTPLQNETVGDVITIAADVERALAALSQRRILLRAREPLFAALRATLGREPDHRTLAA